MSRGVPPPKGSSLAAAATTFLLLPMKSGQKIASKERVSNHNQTTEMLACKHTKEKKSSAPYFGLEKLTTTPVSVINRNRKEWGWLLSFSAYCTIVEEGEEQFLLLLPFPLSSSLPQIKTFLVAAGSVAKCVFCWSKKLMLVYSISIRFFVGLLCGGYGGFF
uniref:Uncharacterized protein n=1 Tax=Ditylenchus dipsaci TaxID=166011 RepID=A0A915D7E1_9BILA